MCTKELLTVSSRFTFSFDALCAVLFVSRLFWIFWLSTHFFNSKMFQIPITVLQSVAKLIGNPFAQHAKVATQAKA